VVKWVETLAEKTYRAPVAGAVILRHSRPFFTHSGRVARSAVPDADADPRIDRQRHAHDVIVAPLRQLEAASVEDGAGHRDPPRHRTASTSTTASSSCGASRSRRDSRHGRRRSASFEIVVKQVNPWWFPPTQDAWAAGAKPVPPGRQPARHALDGPERAGRRHPRPSEPWSIGHSESHGCIRMQDPVGRVAVHPAPYRSGRRWFIVPA
jgi:hypothetical protein